MRSNSRLFSLYVKEGSRYQRLSITAYDKAKAEKMYEAAIQAGRIAGLTVQVRPVHETVKVTGCDPVTAYIRFKRMVLPAVEGKVWFVPSGSAEWAVALPQLSKTNYEQRINEKAALEAAMSEA